MDPAAPTRNDRPPVCAQLDILDEIQSRGKGTIQEDPPTAFRLLSRRADPQPQIAAFDLRAIALSILRERQELDFRFGYPQQFFSPFAQHVGVMVLRVSGCDWQQVGRHPDFTAHRIKRDGLRCDAITVRRSKRKFGKQRSVGIEGHDGATAFAFKGTAVTGGEHTTIGSEREFVEARAEVGEAVEPGIFALGMEDRDGFSAAL